MQPRRQFQPRSGCLQADWSCALLCGRHLHGCGSPAVCLCQKLLQRRTVSAAEVQGEVGRSACNSWWALIFHFFYSDRVEYGVKNARQWSERKGGIFYCYCGNNANLHQAGHRGQSQLTVAAKLADLKPDHISSDGSTDPFLWIQLENLTEGTLFHPFPLQSTLQPTSTPGLWLAFFFMQFLTYLFLFLLLLMPALSSLH